MAAIVSSKLKIANALKASKRFKLAEAVYQEVIDEFPNDFRAYFNLGQLKLSIDTDLTVALELFQKVITIDASIIDTYGILSGLCIKLRQPQQAVEWCFRGLSVDKTDSSCLCNLNVALRQCGRIHEAIKETWIATGVDRSSYCEPVPSSSSRGNQLTIVCIKWGTKYSAEYVNNLHRAVRRHYANPLLRFVCFTDDAAGIDESVVCLPFDEALGSFKAWWLKIQIFSPHSVGAAESPLSGWILYIDLDTVICSSLQFIDETISSDESFSTQCIYVLNAESFQNEGINSSLILWFAGHYTHLYTCLVENYTAITKCTYKFDHYLEMMLYDEFGKFTAISDNSRSSQRGQYLQEVYPTKIVDFMAIRDTGGVKESDTYAIICFPLKPKPHEVCEEWIKAHWSAQH